MAGRTRQAALATLLLLVSSPILAGPGIRFDDVARDPVMGLRYARVRSRTDALFDRLKALPVYGMAQVVATPEKPVYYGSLDAAIHTITADNPGAVLENVGCRAAFRRDAQALSATDHARRAHGGPFDATARFIEVFQPVGKGNFVWNGYRFLPPECCPRRRKGAGWRAPCAPSTSSAPPRASGRRRARRCRSRGEGPAARARRTV